MTNERESYRRTPARVVSLKKAMKVTKRNKVDTLMAGLRHINLECSLCPNKLTEGYFRSHGEPVCIDCATNKPIRIDVDNDY